jgi:hypothetical protein
MAGGDRRKCKCCLKLFRPDPRNRHHQRYCSVPACRAASKAASQARWLTLRPPTRRPGRRRRSGTHRSRRGRGWPGSRPRQAAIGTLRSVNRYIQLRPNIAGFRVTLNDLLSRPKRNSP